jgi:hypothetical protein
MKYLVSASSALILFALGLSPAHAAIFSFDTAQVGTINRGTGDNNFDSGLASLGIISSTITGATAGGGVISALPLSPLPVGFANNVFATGFNGTWTLQFASPGPSSFSFNIWDTNSGPGTGFQVRAFDINGVEIAIANNGITDPGVNGAPNSTTILIASLNSAGIGRITIQDRSTVPGGDDVFIDNLATAIPEPSAIVLLSAALAAFAFHQRGRQR